MKVLITASDSAIGRSLVTKYGGAFDIVGIEKFDVDLTDIKRVVELVRRHRPDVIVHLDEMREDFGALDSVDKMIENYNAVCFKNLQTASKTYGVKKLIVLGSGREYGTDCCNVSEQDFPFGLETGSYPSSKRRISQHAANDNLTVVLRLFDMFGRGCYIDGILMELIYKIVDNQPLVFDKDRLFSYVYSDDAAAIIHRAVVDDLPPGAYNCANPDKLSLSEAVRFVKKACYKLVPVRFEDAGFGNEYTCSTDKLQSFLGDNVTFTPPLLAIGRTFKHISNSLNRRARKYYLD